MKDAFKFIFLPVFIYSAIILLFGVFTIKKEKELAKEIYYNKPTTFIYSNKGTYISYLSEFINNLDSLKLKCHISKQEISNIGGGNFSVINFSITSPDSSYATHYLLSNKGDSSVNLDSLCNLKISSALNEFIVEYKLKQ